MVRESLNGGRVAYVHIFRILDGVEGDPEGMIQAGGKLFDVRCFAVGAYAAKDEDRSSAGICKEKIAVGGRANEAGHSESAAA
jgi:hypothetical protein